MKFYNRTQELEILRRTWVQSKQSACFTVMIGRRRIGKTSLLLESVKGTKYLYLFVSCTSGHFYANNFRKMRRSTGNPDIRNDYPVQGSVRTAFDF